MVGAAPAGVDQRPQDGGVDAGQPDRDQRGGEEPRCGGCAVPTSSGTHTAGTAPSPW
jgi:hypothetical protein